MGSLVRVRMVVKITTTHLEVIQPRQRAGVTELLLLVVQVDRSVIVQVQV